MDTAKTPEYDYKKIVEEFEKWLYTRMNYLDDEELGEGEKLAEIHRVGLALANEKEANLILILSNL